MNIKKFFNNVQNFYFSRNIIWILFALGIFLRVRQYADNRSLWIDEAALAVNFVSRSYAELLSPLDYGQLAPFGFIMVERLAVQAFGPSEYSLRLFPLVAGILAMFLFYRIAGKLLTPAAIPLALGIFAISQPLVYFSSEVKPYSVDVCVALAFLVGAMRIAKNPNMKFHQAFMFGLLGASSVWFSFPSIFVLIAVILVLGFNSYRERRTVPIPLILMFSMWLMSFIICYLFSKHYLSLATSDHLDNYWSDAFMPLVPSLKGLKWYARTFMNIFEFPGGFRPSAVAGMAFLIGVISYGSQKKAVGLGLLVAPIVVVLLASAAHLYPFSDRLILFIVPLLILLVAEGAIKIKAYLGRYNSFLGIGFLVLLLAGPVVTACDRAIHPVTREEIRPAFLYIKDHIQPTDMVYVYTGARKPFDYYSHVNKFKPAHIVGVNSRDDLNGYVKDLQQLEGKPRVWVLFSHVWISNGVNEKTYILNYLDSVGRRMDELEIPAKGAVGLKAGDSGVYLYDLSKPFSD